jgi:HD-like signal output (HDOD) protein
MTSPQILLQRCPELSTLPMVYHKLNEAISNPNCTTGIISGIVKQDPILSIKVLKIVNSAFYGFPHEIDDIAQALLIIGMQQLNDLVLANSIIYLFEKQKIHSFTMENFWKYSLASALTSKILASIAEDQHSDRVFVSSLLHGVGKLIMAITSPEKFLEAYNLSINEKILCRDAEKAVFGFDHLEMNQTLMSSWSLPHTISDISTHYLDPQNSIDHPKEACIVNLSSAITQSLNIGSFGQFYIHPLDESNWRETGLSPTVIDEVILTLKPQLYESFNTFLH